MLTKIITFFTDTIFHQDARDYRNPVVRYLVRQYKLLFYTARGLLEHGTMIRSAALTFYTLTSLVPIAAVIFAVVKGFGLTEGLIENLYATFPQNPEIVDYLINFTQNTLARTQGGLVAMVGIVVLFWSVIKVFGSIESAFNNIWEVNITRSIARQYTDYLTIVMIVPLLWIIANALSSYAQQLLGFNSSTLFFLLSKAASVGVMWFMFSFLYMVIPNAKVTFKSAFTSGMVAGTLFMFFQWGYVYLQQWMTSYNAIYGSFAALPLFLLWLQTSWQILLFGGELSFAYQNTARFAEERESLRISYDNRRKVMLAVMLIIVRRFRDGAGAVSAETIRQELDLPTRIVNDVIYRLLQAGLLIPVRNEERERENTFAPARDINTLTVYGVIEAVEGHGQGRIDLDASPALSAVAAAMEQIKTTAREANNNLRLIDIKETK